MKTFFDKKLNSMKRELTASVSQKIKKSRLNRAVLSTLNQIKKQVEFNVDIQDTLKEVVK